MRVTISIDSATGEQAHALVAAYQRSRTQWPDTRPSPTVTIAGPWSFGITLPPLDAATARIVLFDAHLVEPLTLAELTGQRAS